MDPVSSAPSDRVWRITLAVMIVLLLCTMIALPLWLKTQQPATDNTPAIVATQTSSTVKALSVPEKSGLLPLIDPKAASLSVSEMPAFSTTRILSDVLMPLEENRLFTGDLPAMLERRLIRVLIPYGQTNFFIGADGQPYGFEYEMLEQYEIFLNRDISRRELQTRLYFIPLPFEQLIPMLLDGQGDIIAANMTITPKRQKKVAFTEPYIAPVEEVIVTHESVTDLNTLDDLSGRQINVLRGSSYVDSLTRLNRRLIHEGFEPLIVREADAYMATENILELMNVGVLQIGVADQHIATLWADVLPHIRVHPDLAVNQGGQIGWAVRPDNPALRAHLNSFLAEHKRGTLIGNILFTRYYEQNPWLQNSQNPSQSRERDQFEHFVSLFKKYGAQYDFDWLAIAAQAYQESRFNNALRSPRGAIGIMQVLPDTATSPEVDIKAIEELENNIHAGVKYMHYLRERYRQDENISDEDALFFAYAAYNAGPGRLEQLRRRAAQMGLNANQWFHNVELAALQSIGQETVRYVANIHKYHVAYRLIAESISRRVGAIKAMTIDKDFRYEHDPVINALLSSAEGAL